MSAEKTERLINLTLGLLSSKRFLTKNEIFKNIAGYSGSPETMERMFERDKEDLRSLGIIIDTGSNDTYFEDEVGYRIFPEKYYLDLPKLMPEEQILMSLAVNIFAGGEDTVIHNLLVYNDKIPMKYKITHNGEGVVSTLDHQKTFSG